jgi:hypothetical protein
MAIAYPLTHNSRWCELLNQDVFDLWDSIRLKENKEVQESAKKIISAWPRWKRAYV